MLTDYISPGNRVELKATGKVWMDEDVRTKHIYMSKIMELKIQKELFFLEIILIIQKYSIINIKAIIILKLKQLIEIN
ncbi:MAG: hypothetical protein IJ260_06205 [Butyrivibrio sp.]|nr:hypothetical protein [Butyrivibrio sp.]